jgi:sugar lactone lactonase YvrE
MVAVAALLPVLPAQARPVSDLTSGAAVSATYAGTVGGPGHAAMYPSGVEIAPNGDIVIADAGNDQVAEYTPAGVQVWRVGSEGNGASVKVLQFEQPRDVGVDAAGNVYVADNGNGRVVVLNGSTGAYMNKWKSAVTGGGAPIGITVSTTTANLPTLQAGQRVYVADGNKNQITVWNTDGTPVAPAAAATITSTGACKLNRMRDAAADAAGNVYIANYDSDNILEFTWNGTAWACAAAFGTQGVASSTTAACGGNGSGAFRNPYGVAIGTDPFINSGSPGEAIYVADSNDDCIQEFTPTGTWVANIGAPGDDTAPGTFTQLRRVAVDSAGNVWGADLWGYRVEEFTRSAAGYTYGATIPAPVVPPGSSSTSVFNQVRGMSFDASGDVVAMDSVNQRVDVFDPTGQLINMCGQRGFTSAGDFNWPRGVAVDPATGNYWIADTKQSDIQILQPVTVPAMAGCTATGYVTQTLGTALGDVDYPDSIVIAGGYAWVADTKNNRIESWNVATQTPVSSFGILGSGTGQFDAPASVSVDPSTGNLFVADSLNDRVVELSVSDGTVLSTVATFAAGFNDPYGAASNGNGLLAVADRNNNRVVVINESDGSVAASITGTTVTGGGPTSLLNPENVVFGPDGDLYVADTYHDRILMYTLAASTQLTAPTYSSTLVGPGKASMYPVDVTQDADYYFVLDAGNYRVVAVSRTTGNIDCQIGGLQGSGPGQFGDARALDYDPATSQLYVADTPHNRVEIFSFSDTACAASSPTAFTYLSQFGSGGSGAEQFSQVYGVAVDAVNGWVYAVDGAGRVERSDLAGNYINQFNAGGTLNAPRQVTVAPNSDVLVMNARDHECDVFGSDGTLLFSFGSQGTGDGQFTNDPRGVSVSAGGTMAFVTDSGGKRIEVFALASSGADYTGATFAYTIASGTASGQFVGPRGLTTTSDNHLLVTDEWGFGLHELRFTSAGATPTRDLFGTAPPLPGVDAPRGLQVAANGQVYIVDYWNQRIEYMNPDGTDAQSFGFRGNPSQKGAINFAWSAAIQPGTGDIFVANRESNQVQVFSPTGTSILIFGTNGAANGQFRLPQGIAFAPDGTLYVDDSGNDRVERFSIAAGVTAATWMATYGQKGTGATSPAGDLNNPTGISVAADGTVWVADTRNNRIQSLSPSGVWTTFTAPVGVGTQQGFRAPWGVTVAPDGSIWVADTGNHRIVSMDTSGSLIFIATAASMGIPAAASDSVIYPFSIAFSGTTVYLSDIWNNRVLALITG